MGERYEAYRICQERGHEASGWQAMSNPPWEICKHCGTRYRLVVEVREGSNKPREDQ